MENHIHDKVTGKMIKTVKDLPSNVAKGLSSGTKDSALEIKKFVLKMKQYALTFMNTYTWVIFFIILVVIIKYYFNQLDKEEGNLVALSTDLDVFNPRIRGLVKEEYNKDILIRDYFVMGSYNSCAGGDSWQDWIGIDILKKIISTGVRALDFEIYIKDGECIVGVGPEAEKGKFVLKGSFNSLNFNTVLNTINAYAFGSGAPNPDDPLFINLRIKTNKPVIYEKIASGILKEISKSRRLSHDNGNLQHTVYANLHKRFESKGTSYENIIDQPLKLIKGKAVFICNDIPTNSFWGQWNDNYNGSNKNQYIFMACINISNCIGNCLLLKSFDVVYSHNPKGLKKDLKRVMGLSVPDITTTGKNPKWEIHSKYGCQFTLMNFSNRDAELISYIKNWDLARKAFIVKPSHLRYFPVILKTPVVQKKEFGYGPRKYKSEFASPLTNI